MTDLKRVVDLIRADNKPQARLLLMELLKTDRRNEQAWLYLAACAANKREFEACIQQVLKLNPLNSTALKQAQKYGLPIPQAARQAKKNVGRPARAKGRRRTLRLVLLLLLIVLGLAAVVVVLGGEETPSTVVEEVASPEATQALTPDATAEATSEPTQEATSEPTQEVTQEATPDATEALALIPTAEATEPALEITANPTLDLPISAVPQAYLEGMRFMTGSEDDLVFNATPPGDAPLWLEIRLRDHGEDLALEVFINSQGGNQNLRFEAQAPAQAAHTVLIPVKTAEDIWATATWQAQLNINQQPAFLAEIFVIPPAVSPTPTEAPTEEAAVSPLATGTVIVAQIPLATSTPRLTATAAISPTPTIDFPETETSLRLVYNPEVVYLQNITEANLDISGLRFAQNLPDGEQIAFNATEWEIQPGSQAAGTIYQFQPERCFQVGTETSNAQVRAAECTVLNAWQVRDLAGQFWLVNNGNVRTFLVLQNGTPLAECNIDAGACEFGLLPQ